MSKPTFHLRRDADDSEAFHIIEKVPNTHLSISYHATKLHADILGDLFGERISELADGLRNGESMPIEITATCPDDNSEVLAEQAVIGGAT